jgi:hypothetical protein
MGQPVNFAPVISSPDQDKKNKLEIDLNININSK